MWLPPGLNSGFLRNSWPDRHGTEMRKERGNRWWSLFSLHYGAKKGLSKKSRVEPGSHMHHASRITQPSGKHRKKKLILCHVTSDMPVTQVTPGKPRKFKIQVQSSKSRVAVWGLTHYEFTWSDNYVRHLTMRFIYSRWLVRIFLIYWWWSNPSFLYRSYHHHWELGLCMA